MWNVKVEPGFPNLILDNGEETFDSGVSLESVKDMVVASILIGKSEDNYCMLKICDNDVKSSVVYEKLEKVDIESDESETTENEKVEESTDSSSEPEENVFTEEATETPVGTTDEEKLPVETEVEESPEIEAEDNKGEEQE